MALNPITINGEEYVRVEKSHRPTPKYNIGDRVRVIANKSSRPDVDSYLGDTVQILDIYKYGAHMRDGKPMQAYNVGEFYAVFEDELEPVGDPFDIEEGDRYYWISYRGTVCDDVQWGEENDCIPIANACKDKKLMEQRALHEILERLLWRASIQAGELENAWGANKNQHYEIIYDYDRQDYIAVFHWTCKDHGIYFPSKESAQAAIDNIIKPFVAEHPDFVW